jgi:hypothetical protein
MDRQATPASGPLQQGRSAGLSDVSKSKLFFFAAAGISFLLSVFLFFTGDQTRGVFVGLWVPSILSAGSLLLAGGRHD